MNLKEEAMSRCFNNKNQFFRCQIQNKNENKD